MTARTAIVCCLCWVALACSGSSSPAPAPTASPPTASARPAPEAAASGPHAPAPAPTAASGPHTPVPAPTAASGPHAPVPAPTAASGPHAPVLPASAPGAPDLSALRTLLAPHAAVRFDAGAQDRGCPAEQSLGEYLAQLVQYGEHGDGPTDVHQLAAACVTSAAALGPMAIDPPEDPAFWLCRIDSFTSDPAGESPWHYELRLRVRRSDRALDLRTLACPGAP